MSHPLFFSAKCQTLTHACTLQQRAKAFWIPPGIAEVIGQWLTGWASWISSWLHTADAAERGPVHTAHCVCLPRRRWSWMSGSYPLCLGHAGRLCCCCCFVKALQINHSHYTSNTEAGGWIIPRPRSLILCDPVAISHCVRVHRALLFCAIKEWRSKGVLSLLCRASHSLPSMRCIWSIFWV